MMLSPAQSEDARATRPSRASRRTPSGGPSRPALRLLRALGEPGAFALPDPTRPDALILRTGRAGISLGSGVYPASAARELASHDLVETRPRPGGAPAYALSESGRARLSRGGAQAGEEFGAQHREVIVVAAGEGGAAIAVNAAESPLAWLRRRRGRDGEPLIDAASYEAGERLRRDITIAGLLPSVTARWDGAVASGGGGPRDPAGATDAAIAARQRVRRATEAVGADLGDLLLDLCGFLKGLELIERERGWPPRSAKVVARLALRQLARHYGLDSQARGPERSRGVRSWQADLGEP